MPSPALPPTRSPIAAFVAVFVLAAACAGALIWTLERQERAQQRTQAADVAGDHVQALQRAIELALSANNTLVALVRQGHGNVPSSKKSACRCCLSTRASLPWACPGRGSAAGCSPCRQRKFDWF